MGQIQKIHHRLFSCVLLLSAFGPVAGGCKELAATGELLLCSPTVAGTPANGNNASQCNTPDGRHVAFQSTASNLAPGDGNGMTDVFRKYMQFGSILRCSLDHQGKEAHYGGSSPSIGRKR